MRRADTVSLPGCRAAVSGGQTVSFGLRRHTRGLTPGWLFFGGESYDAAAAVADGALFGGLVRWAGSNRQSGGGSKGKAGARKRFAVRAPVLLCCSCGSFASRRRFGLQADLRVVLGEPLVFAVALGVLGFLPACGMAGNEVAGERVDGGVAP